MSMWQYVGWAGMAAALLAACRTDWQARRIPNSLCLAALGFALAWQVLAPAATPLFPLGPSAVPGVMPALSAAALAFAAFLALHVMGFMGAGDVKLMASVGAFFGHPSHVPPLLASIALAGGLLALVRLAPRARRERGLQNLRLIWMGWMYRRELAGLRVFDPRRDTADRLPYAFAIALGSAAYAALLLGNPLKT